MDTAKYILVFTFIFSMVLASFYGAFVKHEHVPLLIIMGSFFTGVLIALVKEWLNL